MDKIQKIAIGIKTTVCDINGIKVSCVDITGLAKLCGRRPVTIRKMEKQGKFPPAPFRLPGKTTANGVDLSKRLYPLKGAIEFSRILAEKVVQGKEITADTSAELFTAIVKM